MLNPGDVLTLTKHYYVYELLDDHGLVFYVGVSADPAYRFRSHANPKHCDRPIIAQTIAECINPTMRIVSVHPTKKDAELAEYARIREIPGVLNQVGFGIDKEKVRARWRRKAAMKTKKRHILTDSERKEALRAKSRAKSRKRTTEYYRARRIRRALRDASKVP